jgi:hypothetical protein
MLQLVNGGWPAINFLIASDVCGRVTPLKYFLRSVVMESPMSAQIVKNLVSFFSLCP